MTELVKFMVEQFIEKPESLSVTEEVSPEDESKMVITVSVSTEDMGRIIGKQGRIAKAIRTIVKAAQVKTGKKYTVEIAEKKESE